MAIGRKLDALLKERNLKPGTLATMTGINKNTIYAIIKRDSEKVNMAALHKIADALNISIDYFFDPYVEEYLSEQDNNEKNAPAEELLERDEFVRLFSALPPENRKRILDLMQALLASHESGDAHQA